MYCSTQHFTRVYTNVWARRLARSLIPITHNLQAQRILDGELPDDMTGPQVCVCVCVCVCDDIAQAAERKVPSLLVVTRSSEKDA